MYLTSIPPTAISRCHSPAFWMRFNASCPVTSSWCLGEGPCRRCQRPTETSQIRFSGHRISWHLHFIGSRFLNRGWKLRHWLVRGSSLLNLTGSGFVCRDFDDLGKAICSAKGSVRGPNRGTPRVGYLCPYAVCSCHRELRGWSLLWFGCCLGRWRQSRGL